MSKPRNCWPAGMKPKERDISKACLQALAYRGQRLYRRNVGARPWSDDPEDKRRVMYGRAGQSDFWGILPKSGRHLEIEMKRPGGRPSPKQYAWLAEVRAAGGAAYWCDDVDDCLRLYDEVLAGGDGRRPEDP